MRYKHRKCGGNIIVETRTCNKCKKHWGPITFWLSLGIKPVRESKDKYAKTLNRAMRRFKE